MINDSPLIQNIKMNIKIIANDVVNSHPLTGEAHQDQLPVRWFRMNETDQHQIGYIHQWGGAVQMQLYSSLTRVQKVYECWCRRCMNVGAEGV